MTVIAQTIIYENRKGGYTVFRVTADEIEHLMEHERHSGIHPVGVFLGNATAQQVTDFISDFYLRRFTNENH